MRSLGGRACGVSQNIKNDNGQRKLDLGLLNDDGSRESQQKRAARQGKKKERLGEAPP